MVRNVPLLVFCLAVAGCTTVTTPSADPQATPTSVAADPTASPAPDPPPTDDHLTEAMAFAPTNVQMLLFTDWTAIKSSLGMDDVTNGSPMEDRMAVVGSINMTEAAAAGFAVDRFIGHADAWGWDSTDLDWEAEILAEQGRTHVLRFRDGFDLDPVLERFNEREFSTEEVPGGTLRSHELSVEEDWLRATDFAITNSVVLDDGRTLLASIEQGPLLATLEELADQGAKTPELLGAVDALSGASAAIISTGSGTCQGFGRPVSAGSDAGSVEAIRDELAAAAPLSPYGALGVGYSREWEPIGRITFAYGDAQRAAADLPGRRTLAETGISLRTGQPYSESLFVVTDAAATDGTMTLEVEPASDMPRRLIEMVFGRDMLFAACTD